MAESFRDAGIGDVLAGAAAAAGYDQPTPLQAAAAPVIRRGGNVVLHASSGAGVTAAFALPVLDRLSDAGGDGQPRALVLTATQERAVAVAHAVAQLASASGLQVRAMAPGWRVEGADVLVASAARALEAVQTSELKLDAVVSFVIVDAAELFALAGGSALETLITLIPRDAQRVVASATLDGDVQTFIDAHVRKALTVPPRPAAPPRTQEAVQPIAQIGYMLVEARSKDDTLARLLETVEEDALVYVRSAQRAEHVRADLQARGITGATVRSFEDAGDTATRVISYDVPFTVEQMRSIHANGGTVLLAPAERAHFRRLAAEGPFTVKHRRVRTMDVGDIDTFRASIRGALQSEDLNAQLLVLEPLLDDASAAEVAAALSALLRKRAPVAAAAPVAAQAATGAAPAQASAGGFTRLFVSVGSRDNIRPGDLVGAITGEANIKGDQVGRVDIRDSFSVVEVASAVAERVIRALNGTTMRGRSLRVDFDRKGASSGGPRDRGGPPRGPRDRSGPPRRRPPER